MASLSTYHLGVFIWVTICSILLTTLHCTALFEQLINIVRLIEMWMFVRVCVSAYVCVSFNQVEVALHIYIYIYIYIVINYFIFHSIINIPFIILLFVTYESGE